MCLTQWPGGGLPAGEAAKKQGEKRGLREENSLCSAAAVSWSLPLGEQIREGGEELGQERTEGSNREGRCENAGQQWAGARAALV